MDRLCSNPECKADISHKEYRAKYCSRSCAAIVNNSRFPKRGDGKPRYCPCGAKLLSRQKSYCSYECSGRFQRQNYIDRWLAGEETGSQPSTGGISKRVRDYMLKEAGYKCTECGWCKPNPVLGKPILSIDHIDGNWRNNRRENLIVLCYNCHTLTPTFNALNIGNGQGVRGSGNRMFDRTVAT